MSLSKKTTVPVNKSSLGDQFSLLRHQLKSPLTTISLYSESLLAGDVGDLTPSQKDYIQEIHQASKKMVEMVETLLKKKLRVINKKIWPKQKKF